MNYLKYASEFTLVEADSNWSQEIVLKKMKQQDGTTLWAVLMNNSALSVDGTYFSPQPSPSSRDKQFFDTFRFPSPESAIKAFKHFLHNGQYFKPQLMEMNKRFPKDL